MDFLDHHCVFTDNCVGRKNMKYFIHFIWWADFTLTVGVWALFYNIYWRNIPMGYGSQGIWEALSYVP